MRNPNSWHPEYAAEACKRHEHNAVRWDHDDLLFVKVLCSTYEVLPLVKSIAAEIDDKKLADIAETVGEIEKQREAQGNRCYRKVTDKQRHVLAVALLEKFGTPRSIVKTAWSVTDQQIDNADI